MMIYTATPCTKLSIDEVIEKIKQIPEVTFTDRIGDFLKQHAAEVDAYFRTILKKRNISESDWMRYGRSEDYPALTRYYYKDEPIFFITKPEIKELDPGTTQTTLAFYYGETND